MSSGNGHWAYCAVKLFRMFEGQDGEPMLSIAQAELPLDVAEEVLDDLSEVVDDIEFSWEDLQRLNDGALYEWAYDEFGNEWMPFSLRTFTITEEFLEFLGLEIP